jgi:hypothetical protein
MLYRGEEVKIIPKPTTPLGGKRRVHENSKYPKKVDKITENKYFGKDKFSKSAKVSQSRFYERFHVYAVETDISGVVESPETSSLMMSSSLGSLGAISGGTRPPLARNMPKDHPATKKVSRLGVYMRQASRVRNVNLTPSNSAFL